jgi:Ca2+/Na+ antiporter
MTLLAVLGHIGFSVLLGMSLLSFISPKHPRAEALMLSFLLGLYAETLAIGMMLMMGISLMNAVEVVFAVTAVLIVVAWRRSSVMDRFEFAPLRWYEWLAIAASGETFLFGLWQIVRTPLYFDDALANWGGRARALFGGVNWTMDPQAPFFLAKHIGHGNYPLQVVIWHATTALLDGQWTDADARADNLVFLVLIIGLVWLTVLRLSGLRWLAAASAFVIAAVPLHAFHAAAGHTDIAVEAFLVGSLACLLRKDMFLAGILLAGAAWSKNDALVLYTPAFFLAAFMMWRTPSAPGRKRPNVFGLILGFATLLPWLVFNFRHTPYVTPNQEGLSWHANAFLPLLNSILIGETNSILWVFVLLAVLWSSKEMAKDGAGRVLLIVLCVSLVSIALVYVGTDAYVFLLNEATIHRTMMQLSGVGVVTAMHGIWLKLRLPSAHSGMPSEDTHHK